MFKNKNKSPRLSVKTHAAAYFKKKLNAGAIHPTMHKNMRCQ
jgi:hypothetical protein